MRGKLTAILTVAIFILSLGLNSCSCTSSASGWTTYRFNALRQGDQLIASALSDPTKVKSLAVKWTFTPPSGESGEFYASPIVVGGSVFVGSTAGYFYAIEANSGKKLWQYPPHGSPLLGTCGLFNQGILSSAVAYGGVVIFGAADPDKKTDSGNGSGRLWALNEKSGKLEWKSSVVAHVTGCTRDATAPELHERITHSAPLVFAGNVYVGVADAGDNPVQNGKVMAVNLSTHDLVPGFSFSSTGTRGGGVWNGPATDLSGVLFTTGNTRCDGAGCQGTCDAKGSPTGEPSPNYGLSTVKVDPLTGKVNWFFQPVPYCEDNDPDWAAGATIMLSSCGSLAASVQKDGWSYALDSTNGSCQWQFPPTAGPTCKFPKGTSKIHGDTGYKRPGAAWNDVLIINTGGEALPHDGVTAGYGRLHALNACATSEADRVRWLVDVPHADAGGKGNGYNIGAPTVTGGIVYVTTEKGWVVALADPSIAPAAGYRCSDIDFGNKTSCTKAGYAWVPIPQVLADVSLDGTSAAGMRNEPAIADGRLFVSTVGGHVYMLSP
jgi:outer membrane protein assembly factor BamB